jgi:hypothetical protein
MSISFGGQMKTVIYSFENKKPKFFELDRYYYIKTQKQLDKLIDKLLDIDAVCTPAALTFPVVLELKSGFAPTLVRVSHKALVKEHKRVTDLLVRIRKLKKAYKALGK